LVPSSNLIGLNHSWHTCHWYYFNMSYCLSCFT